MSKLSAEEEKIAKAAIEENGILRQMLNDSAINGPVARKNRKVSLDTYDSIFSLRRGNDILKGEIAELQNQLDSYGISAAETIHKFNRLREKRANLRNETRGLRNIMTHQTPKVQEANRFLAQQLTIKKTCDEKNCAAKEEVKRLKEAREKEMDNFYAVLRKEAYLREQLECVPAQLKIGDYDALKAAIALKESTIRKLEDDIEKTRFAKGSSKSYDSNSYDNEMTKLRAEYDILCERIQMLTE